MAAAYWEPNDSDSLDIRKNLAKKVVHDIDGLVAAVAKKKSGSILAQFDRLTRDAVRGAPAILHPEIFFWYHALKRAIEGRDAAEVARKLNEIPEVVALVEESLDESRRNEKAFGALVDLRMVDPLRIKVMARGTQTAGRIANKEVQLEPCPPPMSVVAEALSLIGTRWPELMREIQDHVRAIHFFNGSAAIGFTDNNYHGAIFLKEALVNKSPVFLAEEIIHEASHTRLNAEFSVRALLKNDAAEKYMTPLRREPRPMFGLLHQAFVLCRLARFYRDVVPNREKLAKISGQLKEALGVVNGHAKMLGPGVDMLASINAFERELSAG